MSKIRIAILGAGGLAKICSKIIDLKEELILVAICDKEGYAYKEIGISSKEIEKIKKETSIADLPYGKKSSYSILEIIKLKDKIDAVFIALPNLPNTFIKEVTLSFLKNHYEGVLIDVLKRTQAMKEIFTLDTKVKEAKCTYITGCGATPGLLTAAAVLAAQSFIKIEEVKIRWGVGVKNWREYKATIREDIAHLPGFSVEKAKVLTEEEIEKILEARNGILELHNMEHADDIMLEKAGIVNSSSQVNIGGIMDTKSSKKPISTTMSLTGITFEGKRSTHQFILGDETSMAANVIGPALGYLKKGIWLRKNQIYGVFSAAELMPCWVK